MSADQRDKAKRLLAVLGSMDDSFLDEAESVDIASVRAARRRVIQYSALGVGVGAAASIGIAVAVRLLRPKRAVAHT